MLSRKIIMFFLAFIPLSLIGQRNELLKNTLSSLVVNRNGEWNSIPCLSLGTRDFLQISFDDLAQEYHRYRYRIEPMTWNWQPNQKLLSSEFLARGIDNETIDNYEESINTTVYYTHYSFKFPDEHTTFKLSGNYRLVIYDDDAEEDIAIIPFYVIEDESLINVSINTNTDIDFHTKHQQLTFSFQPKPSLTIHNIDSEIHTVVMQNLSPYTTAYDPHPDYVTTSGLQWEHAKELIFNGVAEFHKIETSSIRIGGMGIDNIKWYSPYYHATLIPDEPLENYIYDEDANGAFLVKTIDNNDSDVEADYLFTHFTLKTGKRLDGDVYIDGAFTNHALTPEYQMTYNYETQSYEATLLMKQGYYNYQYILVNNNKVSLDETQGNFFQTENRYSIFVYYSQRGSRYDRIIGLKDIRYISSRK